MKKYSAFICFFIMLYACAPKRYQSIQTGWTGVIAPNETIMTPELRSRLITWFNIEEPGDYGFRSVKVNTYEVAVIERMSDDTRVAGVVMDGTGKILQTTWYKPWIDATIIDQLNAKAIQQGKDKNENDFGVFKISNSTGTWYEFNATFNGEFTSMCFDSKLKPLKKEQVIH